MCLPFTDHISNAIDVQNQKQGEITRAMHSLIAFDTLVALAYGMQFRNSFAICAVSHIRPDGYAYTLYRTNANDPQLVSPRSALYHLGPRSARWIALRTW